LAKPFYFLTKLLSIGKTFFPSWLNLYLLTKSFYFMAKPVALGKTILLHGYTFISWQIFFISWLNIHFLAQPF